MPIGGVADGNGWDLTWLADEGVSGAVPPESHKRFKAALALLEVGEADSGHAVRATWRSAQLEHVSA
jgi:hypothetical protein